MWKCSVCGKENPNSVVYCQCGYDESKNLGAYLTLTRFTDRELELWNQSHQVGTFGKAWTEWSESVKKELDSMDEMEAQRLFEKVKNHYIAAVKEIKENISQEEIDLLKNGYDYYWGANGKEKNKQKGIQLLYQSAERGITIAECEFGLALYYNLLLHRTIDVGMGVMDEKTAEEWCTEYYSRAAKKGHIWAQRRLADRLFEGKGCERNESKSLEWYMCAADVLEPEKQDKIIKAYELCGWYAKEYADDVRQGEGPAQYELGEHFRKGIAGIKDYEKSIKYYEKIAEHTGYPSLKPNAYFVLGHFYGKGLGVRCNKEKSQYWYKKLVEWDKKNTDEFSKEESYARLSFCYRHGLGVERDMEAAARWYGKIPPIRKYTGERTIRYLEEILKEG